MLSISFIEIMNWAIDVREHGPRGLKKKKIQSIRLPGKRRSQSFNNCVNLWTAKTESS